MTKQQSPHLPQLFLRLEVRSKEGLILSERYEEAHSWTKNGWILNTFAGQDGVGGGEFLEAGGRVSVSTGATVYSSTPAVARYSTFANYGYYNNAVGNGFGIQVGTSNDEFLPWRYSLPGLVPHGNGADQLYYQAQVAPVTSYDSGTFKFTTTMSRILNNNSGGTITVRCVGLVWRGNLFVTSSYDDICYLVAHDVLGSPQAVPNGAQLTVTYEIVSPKWTINEDYAYQFTNFTVGASAYGGWVVGTSSGMNASVLICSPKVGGEDSSKCFGPVMLAPASSWDGPGNTATLLAIGQSEIAAFASAANASGGTGLGGYSDWYVPALNECQLLFASKDSAPEGEGFASAIHWSSTAHASQVGNAYYYNMGTGVNASTSKSHKYYVRLVRRQPMSGIPKPGGE